MKSKISEFLEWLDTHDYLHLPEKDMKNWIITEFEKEIAQKATNEGLMTYRFDPTTGKPLTRAGFSVGAISPMTQKEVDRQCDFVASLTDRKDA